MQLVMNAKCDYEIVTCVQNPRGYLQGNMVVVMDLGIYSKLNA